MMLDLQSRLAQLVRAAAREAFDVGLPTIAFQYPPKIALGDLALTAPFDLAKTLKRKPRDIAERLATALSSTPGVRRAEVGGGGCVNLFPDPGALAAGGQAPLPDAPPAPAPPGTGIVGPTAIHPHQRAHTRHLQHA